MALGKQAKVLTKSQMDKVLYHASGMRNGLRNKVICLLSMKAGLRAKEISRLKWVHLMNAEGDLGDFIHLPDDASKGKSGREIPINKDLKEGLIEVLRERQRTASFDPHMEFVVRSERGCSMSSQSIVNFFKSLYSDLGLIGCSSHSGRRTFITNCARKIGTVGGSLRDVQYLAGHSSLQTTQRYIEGSAESKVKVVGLV